MSLSKLIHNSTQYKVTMCHRQGGVEKRHGSEAAYYNKSLSTHNKAHMQCMRNHRMVHVLTQRISLVHTHTCTALSKRLNEYYVPMRELVGSPTSNNFKNHLKYCMRVTVKTEL